MKVIRKKRGTGSSSGGGNAGKRSPSHGASRGGRPQGRFVSKRRGPDQDYDNESESDRREGERPFETASVKAAKPAKKSAVDQAFRNLWEMLFTTPVHLDSALSKQSPSTKSILAQIVPAILARPVSLAEALGVGVGPGEPWELEPVKLARWSAAAQIASRLYDRLSEGVPKIYPVEDDFPSWMRDEWKKEWGESTAKGLVNELSQAAPLSLRVSRKTDPSELLKEMRRSGIPVRIESSDLVPTGLRLSGYAPVLNTPWFEQGLFEIQDEGSQLMSFVALWPELFADALSDKPGSVSRRGSVQAPRELPAVTSAMGSWTVVDACAGAGGKSLAIADAIGGKGRVYSYDISVKKLQALKRRASRAGLRNIQAVALEAGKEPALITQFKETADIVLVDAPCSGWGVLRRNSDIKWRQKNDTLERMPPLQLELLTRFANLVKPGGRLVYGVCTFRQSETRDVVRRFVKDHPEFKPAQGGYLGPGPCDGFFMQVLEKKKKG